MVREDNLFEGHLGLVGGVLVANRQPGEQLTAQAFDLLGGKSRLAQRFAQQAEQQRQVLHQRAPAKTGIVHAGAKPQRGSSQFERLEHLLKSRRCVPRSKASDVKCASPSFSAGSNRLPPGRYPLITTEGLAKLLRASRVIPLGSSTRVMSSGPGREFIRVVWFRLMLPPWASRSAGIPR